MTNNNGIIENTNEDYNKVDLLAGYKDENDVVHTEAYYGELTGEIEEKVSAKDVQGSGSKTVRTILEECVVQIGTLKKSEMKKQKWREIIQGLTVGDQDFLLVEIRKDSVGEEIQVGHKCPSCKTSLKTTIDLEELEIEPFKGEFEIEFELPKGMKMNGEVMKEGTIRLTTGLDREIIEPVSKNNAGKGNTLLLTRLIKDVEGKSVMDKHVRKLSMKDRDYLLRVLYDNTFGYIMESEITCTSCGTEFSTGLSMQNFL